MPMLPLFFANAAFIHKGNIFCQTYLCVTQGKPITFAQKYPWGALAACGLIYVTGSAKTDHIVPATEIKIAQ